MIQKITFLVRQLWGSRGVQQSMLVIFGNSIGTGLSAIAIILLSRLLGPSQFGEFSIGFALALMLNRINDLGLSFAIQKYAAQSRDQDQINRIFSLATLIKLMGVGLIILIGLISYEWISRLLNFSNPLIILIAFVLSGCTTLFEHVQSMLQALHRFKQVVLATIIQSSFKLGAALLFTISSFTLTSPILAWYLSATLIPVLFFKQLLPKWFSLSFKTSFSAEQKLIRLTAGHAAVGFVAAGIIENIDILFVQKYLNTYEAGLLGGVSRIALLFSLIAYSLSNVLNPRVAKYQDSKHLYAFIKKAVGLVGVVSLGFLAFLPLSRLVLSWTIGDAYLGGLGVLNILVAASFLSIAVVPFIALFFSLDTPWYFSVSGLLQLVLILAGNIIFVPVFGLEAAAWTRLVTRLALFVFTVALSLYLVRRKYAPVA